jgi:hypothetical protein
MTKAVCMNCGELKFGAYNECARCSFKPRTLFDLTMSEIYSDRYVNEAELKTLAAKVQNNRAVAESREGELFVDTSIYMLLERRLADQSFRDMLTLVRRAKDGLFRKELNMHLIGPDGYESAVAVRGKDIDRQLFDAARNTGDGDLYLQYYYEQGHRKTSTISKRDWYILYDKMLLVERGLTSHSAYVSLLDKIYDELLDAFVRYGTIIPSSGDTDEQRKINNNERASHYESRDQSEPRILSFREWQDQIASEIEVLSDEEAKETYGALVSIVHQMKRMKAGFGKPMALDDAEVFLKSFESYVGGLDTMSTKELETDYETIRRSAINVARADVRLGTQALMVIILGEMIRRQDNPDQMAGYRRAHKMLNRLERSLAT